jgi:hypothetical protein
MRSMLVTSTLAIALLGLTPPALPRIPAKPLVVTTELNVSVAQYLGIFNIGGFCYAYVTGNLTAHFDATQVPGGWSVSAYFKPNGLSSQGTIQGNVTSKAIGSTSLVPGLTGSLSAGYLKLSGSKLSVQCAPTVDVNGVVSLPSVLFEWYGAPATCGSNGNANGHQPPPGPCTGC